MHTKFLFILGCIIFPVVALAQASTPKSSEAKRYWNIADMYIEEASPDLAVNELKKVISVEAYAPAYLKLVELCYQIGDTRHLEIAQHYAKEFANEWPSRAEEMNDVTSIGEARQNLKMKKFYDALIGNWHPAKIPIEESVVCMKVRRNENGRIQLSLPKEMWDFDYHTSWQNGHFMQWDGDNGVMAYDDENGYDGYRIKITSSSGSIWWYYVDIYLPFNQPSINDGEITVQGRITTKGPNNAYHRGDWREYKYIKD